MRNYSTMDPLPVQVVAPLVETSGNKIWAFHQGSLSVQTVATLLTNQAKFMDFLSFSKNNHLLFFTSYSSKSCYTANFPFACAHALLLLGPLGFQVSYLMTHFSLNPNPYSNPNPNPDLARAR